MNDQHSILLRDLVVMQTDFIIIFFYFSEIEQFTTKDLIFGENNMGARSDIARYEIVYRHGGMYLDTDSIRL